MEGAREVTSETNPKDTSRTACLRRTPERGDAGRAPGSGRPGTRPCRTPSEQRGAELRSQSRERLAEGDRGTLPKRSRAPDARRAGREPVADRVRRRISEPAPAARVATTRVARDPAWSRWSSFAVGSVALALYLPMTPGVCGNKDASEFTLVLATLGVAHPTGYPLYTVAGHGFVLAAHALGASWAWAANAFSAVGGACAVGLLHALAKRLLERGGVSPGGAAAAALLPAAAFGLNPAWTVEAAVAEVNSWHLAWTMAAALMTVATLVALERPDDGRDHRRAAGWGLMAGAGLAHHATSVLAIVPFTIAQVAASVRAGRWRWRLLAIACAGAALPLLSYGYIFWRAFHPAAVQWSDLAPSLGSALDHVLGAEYSVYLGRFAPVGAQRELLAAYVWPWLVPALVLLAAWSLIGRDWPGTVRAALVAAASLAAAYAVSYGVADPSSYFLAPLAVALAAAPAACAAWRPLRRRWLVAAAALGIVIAAAAWVPVGLERPRDFRRVDRALAELWSSVPYARGFVVWNNDMTARLRAYQRLEGLKPGLEVVNPLEVTHAWPRRLFEQRYGFDPAPQAPLRARVRAAHPGSVIELNRVLTDAVAAEINRRSPLPVALFVPESAAVRVLPKATAGPAAAPGLP